MLLTKKSLKIKISRDAGSVSALLYAPAKPAAILVFAHGAGAGIKNKFMESVSLLLAEEGIAVLRFNFPYMEAGKKVPDRKPVATAAVAAAVQKAGALFPKLPLFAGGKSFGGRMTSTAASEGMLPQIKGIIFFGFPLHAPGKPSGERAGHLFNVEAPMLFLQGTRDALASMELIKPLVKKLGKRARLFIVEGADHSFHISAKAQTQAGIPKEKQLKDKDVLRMLCGEVKRWTGKLV